MKDKNGKEIKEGQTVRYLDLVNLTVELYKGRLWFVNNTGLRSAASKYYQDVEVIND